MVGWRECAGCGKELPEELFREDNPQCRICARKEKLRNPVVKPAPNVVAQPREPSGPPRFAEHRRTRLATSGKSKEEQLDAASCSCFDKLWPPVAEISLEGRPALLTAGGKMFGTPALLAPPARPALRNGSPWLLKGLRL